MNVGDRLLIQLGLSDPMVLKEVKVMEFSVSKTYVKLYDGTTNKWTRQDGLYVVDTLHQDMNNPA